jgi:hypothetical protein
MLNMKSCRNCTHFHALDQDNDQFSWDFPATVEINGDCSVAGIEQSWQDPKALDKVAFKKINLDSIASQCFSFNPK